MAASDLTTPAAVRAFLQVPSGETEQDAITATLISAASRAIMRHTQREFAPPATGKTREFENPAARACRDGLTVDTSTAFLDLAPYDLRAFTSADGSSDDGVSWTAIDRTSIRLYPRPAADGVYTALRLSSVSYDLVRVTGDWGWDSVPEDVEQACVLTVAVWLRRDVATFSTTFSIDEDRLERPEALPSAVRGMLSDFCRPSVL